MSSASFAPAATGDVVPDRAAFHAAARRGNLLPVYRELIADGDTPVSAFAKLRDRGRGFLLESVVGGEKWAAYSFIGCAPRAVLRVEKGRATLEARDIEGTGEVVTTVEDAPDPAAAVGQLVARYRAVPPPGLPRFFGGAVGYLGYDAVRAWEPRALGVGPDDALALPDAVFLVTDSLVIFDNLRQTVKLCAAALVEEGASPSRIDAAYDAAVARIEALARDLAAPSPLRPLSLQPGATIDPGRLASSLPRDRYLAAVGRAREHILAGDAFQIVLSQRLTVPAPSLDALDAYRALRVINPSPYMFHLELDGMSVTGASPETLVRLEGRRVEVRPIAGTRPRGHSAADDARLAAELLADEKERAEHVMLIDLGRNDVGRVARLGTVRVDERMVIERYSHVMHMVSLVSGELAEGKGPLDVLRACFPAGTLSGAPKIRAMQIIDDLEPVRRGVYGGAVGYLSFPVEDRPSNLDLAIAIRTLVAKDGAVHVQAGAGIVYDSKPEAEYEETLAKARAALRAVAIAQRGAVGPHGH